MDNQHNEIPAVTFPNGPRTESNGFIGGPPVHEHYNSYPNLHLANLINKIDNWGRDRQLVREHGCTALAQFKKLREEIDEWEEAIKNGEDVKMVDGGGDAITVIIQILRLTQVTMVESLERAYSEIRYRKGKMVDGIFIKEE